jgi:hypothetical protein
MLGHLLFAVTVASVSTPAPSPDPTPTLKTIIRVHSSPLCSTLASAVFRAVTGLQINDKLIATSGPLLVGMGKELLPDSYAGKEFDKLQAQWGNAPGGVHNTNPGLELDNQRLLQITSEIAHNLAIIDEILADPDRFPSEAKTEDDKVDLLLKAQLQAIADQQRKNLNVLSGLADTFSMQDLIAKGDGTQGAINGGGSRGQVSHNDQDVSFQDAVTGPSRGRVGHAVDPTVDQDPAVTVNPTLLQNNPMARFYAGVVQNQQTTSQAENVLTPTIVAAATECKS